MVMPCCDRTEKRNALGHDVIAPKIEKHRLVIKDPEECFLAQKGNVDSAHLDAEDPVGCAPPSLEHLQQAFRVASILRLGYGTDKVRIDIFLGIAQLLSS